MAALKIFLVGISTLALFLGLIILMSLINGFVLMTLWEWFVTPTIGWRTINTVEGIGLGLLFSFITYHYKPSIEDDEEQGKKATMSALVGLVYPWIVLLLGYVVQFFI